MPFNHHETLRKREYKPQGRVVPEVWSVLAEERQGKLINGDSVSSKKPRSGRAYKRMQALQHVPFQEEVELEVTDNFLPEVPVLVLELQSISEGNNDQLHDHRHILSDRQETLRADDGDVVGDKVSDNFSKDIQYRQLPLVLPEGVTQPADTTAYGEFGTKIYHPRGGKREKWNVTRHVRQPFDRSGRNRINGNLRQLLGEVSELGEGVEEMYENEALFSEEPMLFVVSRTGKLRDKWATDRRQDALLSQDILIPFLQDQIAEPEGLIIKPNSSGDEIFALYKETDEFMRTVSLAKFHSENGVSQTEQIAELSGKIFSDIAYAYRDALLEEGEVLLSPERTFSLWRKLYPYAELGTKRYDMHMLKGISVPDGVILAADSEQPLILGLVEYTLHTNDNVRGKQKGVERLVDSFPQLIGRTPVTDFVIPQVTSENQRVNFDNRGNVAMIEVPFERREFSMFMSQVSKEHSLEFGF